jgi:hypothetical protein
MAKRRRTSKRSLPQPAPLVEQVYERIQAILDQARGGVVRSINVEMVRAYWLVGRDIVQEEQRDSSRSRPVARGRLAGASPSGYNERV